LPDGWSKRGRRLEKEARAREKKLIEWWNKNRGPDTRPLRDESESMS
jgi:hypothetical protein